VILLAILVLGLFAGWLANIILGGSSRPADWTPLLIAGFAGSFVGGMLFSLIAGDGLKLRPSGIIGSILGAVIVLFVMQKLGWAGRPARRRT
jgi:uncharacterized membrane protein YeaQ/YmgE (transglycosylase-associated protein family)